MRGSERGGIFFKLLVLLVLVALAGALYLLRYPLLRAVGEYWVVDEPLEHTDAILVLGDDNYLADRAARAAELYRAGWAPLVMASGRQIRPDASLADLTERDLRERGVPAQAIVRVSHRASTTFEEAQALRGTVVQRGWHRVTLVTSNFHTRRARYIYRRVFPPSVELRVAAARDASYDPDRWWQSSRGLRLVFHEAVGLGWAWWESRQVPPPPAPSPARP